MNRTRILALAAALVLFPGVVSAQTALNGAAKKPSLMQRLHAKMAHIASHKPAKGAVSTPVVGHNGLLGVHKSPSSLVAPVGAIIGNSSTRVYHLPGDKNLPAPKNRVYFKTAAAAEAAGYRASGSGRSAAHGHKPAKKSVERKTASPGSATTLLPGDYAG